MTTLHDESVAFWSQNQVAHLPVPITRAESWRALERRNDLYPGLLDLMPVDKPGQTVLDFGCGPGHDTVMFLQNGARHVYAYDCSEYALAMTTARVKAHGFANRCSVRAPRFYPMNVDHVHAAGVIHHLADPVGQLQILRLALRRGGEIRMMVYSAESWFFQHTAHGSLEEFEQLADGAAPIAKAWTRQEVVELAAQAGLTAEYVGSYRNETEPEGPGLMSCWSLR